MTKKNISTKWIVLVVALLVMMIAFALKAVGPLRGEALNMLGVIVGVLLLLVFDVFPIPITCLFAVVCLLIFRCVGTIGQAFSGYSNHILYFTLASFGITTALAQSTLSKRLLFFLIKFSRKSSKSILFVLMLCNAILSSIVSNVAAVLLFIPIVNSFLQCYEQEEDRKKTKRAYMMGLMLSAMIGGMMTPAGSSINLLTLNALEQYADKYIGFLQWMGVGIPASIAILLVAYGLILLVFPPASMPKDEIIAFSKQFRFGKFSAKESYTLAVILGAVFLWILSSWFPSIHITVVAVVALVLLFIPGFEILSWEKFSKDMCWETFFIAGTMISLANCVVETGLSEFLLTLLFPNEVQLPLALVAALIAAMTFVVMVLIPSAPAAISILGPFVISFALKNGYNPCVLIMVCGICVSNCYLLPLDTPAMVIYSQKPFKMFELPRVTALLQIAVIAIMAILVVPLCKLWNIM